MRLLAIITLLAATAVNPLAATTSTDEEFAIAYRELVSELNAAKQDNNVAVAANRAGQIELAVVKEQARAQAEDATRNQKAAVADKARADKAEKAKGWWKSAACIGWGIILSVVAFFLIRAWYRGTLITTIRALKPI